MGWKKLVVLVSVFLFASCLNFYKHPKGGFRPKKSNFSLAKEPFSFNKNIDTTAVYVDIDTIKYKSFNSVLFMKFFNNGRYLINRKYASHSFSKKNTKPGIIGYYLLDNKNIIHLEYYFVDPLKKGKQEYIKKKGFLRNDSIFLYDRFVKDKKDIYVKQKLNFIPEPSNW